MASSSVSQDDHDVEHDFAIASRRAKVRSARANRAVNTMSCRALGEELERGGEVHEAAGDHYHQHHHQHQHIPTKYDQQTSVVLVESNDASPKPIIRGLNKDKRPIPRGAHAGKSNKGIRDRRKLREKRRSTAIGVMHLPSTESTGGSTGEDENEENSVPVAAAAAAIAAKVVPTSLSPEPEEKVQVIHNKGKSESDLDADDEAAQDSSDLGLVKIHHVHGKEDATLLKLENQRLKDMVETKDRRIAMLEIQVGQLTKQIDEIKEKLLNTR
ncbi:uncharacterized protein LOC110856779 isoform X2 [Folsomia candida]|uniref:uncharacterized protein LOC110856779 isoform X2 n=1 Tax=Folsomia candida TaxID=158441 RepID=UPI000B8F1D0F|nr:uncharacterized protein LOC110856779 isoform X2 [Folsomia candida]